MSAKHTPGPWVAGRPDMGTIVDGVESKWIYSVDDQYVAVASGRIKGEWNEVMANARLIGAAPELAASLVESLTWVIAWVGTNRDNPRAARSAIDHLRKFIAVLDKADVDHGIRLDGLDVIEAAIARTEGDQS